MLSGQEVSKKPLASRNATACLPLKLPLRVRAALSCRDTRQQWKSFGALAGGESPPLTGRSGEASRAFCPPQSLPIGGLMPGCCERSALNCWISKLGTAQAYRKRIFDRRRPPGTSRDGGSFLARTRRASSR